MLSTTATTAAVCRRSSATPTFRAIATKVSSSLHHERNCNAVGIRQIILPTLATTPSFSTVTGTRSFSNTSEQRSYSRHNYSSRDAEEFVVSSAENLLPVRSIDFGCLQWRCSCSCCCCHIKFGDHVLGM